jgi:c-di-GMP-binding flagellar brake protein YcgR
MTSTQDKRQFPRLDSSHLISYTHFDKTDHPDGVGMAKTLDLSQGGVTIQINRFFPVDSGLEMVIALEERLISVRGKVVHVREIEKDLYEVGICFTLINDADRKSLVEFFKKSPHHES